MKDHETISQQPHELNYAALELGVPVWKLLKVIYDLGTNNMQEVYDYIKKEKESPVEPVNTKIIWEQASPPMRNKQNVLDWAASKNLLKYENRFVQFAKTVSEVGELGDALIKDNKEEQIDALGDCVVTLIILANQCGFDIEDCLESAYQVIKNRTGKTNEHGTFIKD